MVRFKILFQNLAGYLVEYPAGLDIIFFLLDNEYKSDHISGSSPYQNLEPSFPVFRCIYNIHWIIIFFSIL